MQGGNSCSELFPDATRLSQLLSGWWRANPSPGGSPGTVCPSTLKRLARPATGLQQRETPALPTQDASRKKVNFPHPCSLVPQWQTGPQFSISLSFGPASCLHLSWSSFLPVSPFSSSAHCPVWLHVLAKFSHPEQQCCSHPLPMLQRIHCTCRKASGGERAALELPELPAWGLGHGHRTCCLAEECLNA